MYIYSYVYIHTQIHIRIHIYKWMSVKNRKVLHSPWWFHNTTCDLHSSWYIFAHIRIYFVYLHPGPQAWVQIHKRCVIYLFGVVPRMTYVQFVLSADNKNWAYVILGTTPNKYMTHLFSKFAQTPPTQEAPPTHAYAPIQAAYFKNGVQLKGKHAWSVAKK